MKNNAAWMFVTDHRCGRLIRATYTPQGALHLDEIDRVDEIWDEKEHGRPPLVKRGTDIHGARSGSHEHEERARRHARHLVEFLAREVAGRKIETVLLCAPSSVLGHLRHSMQPALARHVSELHGEFAQFALPDLLRNESIGEALRAAISRSST